MRHIEIVRCFPSINRLRKSIRYKWRHERSKAENENPRGNSARQTAALRAGLPKLFAELGIEILADAGCGEFDWMSEISEPLRLYLGYDCVEDLIAGLRRRHSRRPGHFFSGHDITVDLLPRWDAILCRDVLNWHPLSLAKAALKLLKQSGSRYLIATTYARDWNEVVRLGHWHPIALTAPPFELPPPRFAIPEPGQPAKSLGVWPLADVPG
jgi:hypothetical protein